MTTTRPYPADQRSPGVPGVPGVPTRTGLDHRDTSERLRRIRTLVARHPIAAFLTMVFSISYPLMSLPILASHGVLPGGGFLRRLPVGPDELSCLVLTLGALLPAAVFVTWAAEGRPGLVRLRRRMTHWRIGIGSWLVVLTRLPLLTIASALLLGDALRSIDLTDLLRDQLTLLLINFVLVNFWEETAWVGVVQTRLERRHNVFVAGLMSAVPFGFAHWPLAFLDDFTVTSAVQPGAVRSARRAGAAAAGPHPSRQQGQSAGCRADAQHVQPHQ